MTKARNLQRADKIFLGLTAEVLSVEPISDGFVKVRVSAIGSKSLNFADGSGVLEIICKSGRLFSSRPHRWDDGEQWPPRRGDDDDDDGDGGRLPPAPNNLQKVE
jgi:hypothetical protein